MNGNGTSGPTGPRIIEQDFPLLETSLDSVHEKNVRHGHISTLHIWPARRPLAASRAALITTLLPDPGDKERRDEILRRLAGRIQKVEKRKVMPSGYRGTVTEEQTIGGILHWGRESGPDLDWFRRQIREAYGGRAPKVMDPFAGGGAIPLEAMRLGCDVTAVDINPVAWFIEKCTLEYPQRLAGQTRPLPDFARKAPGLMEAFFKQQGLKGAMLRTQMERLGLGVNQAPMLEGLPVDEASFEADLAWHVRAWGIWVLERAWRDLERFYPEVDGKPTVAYLWARTVTCSNCHATVPLLKTRWLCKKDKKRVRLTAECNADRTGVVFGVQSNVPVEGANSAQRREADKRLGSGTMSRAGVTCRCCQTVMNMEYLRHQGLSQNVGAVMTAVVVDGPNGKEYRLPTEQEILLAGEAAAQLDDVFAAIPYGIPKEQTPGPAGSKMNSCSLRLYGVLAWKDMFPPRQLLVLGTFVRAIRDAHEELKAGSYPADWREALVAYLAASLDRMADRMSSNTTWDNTRDGLSHVFQRFALPVVWDFGEASPFAEAGGGFAQQVDWIARVIENTAPALAGQAEVLNQSATEPLKDEFDVVITDPPYYDAISYSDMMDFFYVWLRRVLHGLSPEIDRAFAEPLGPKWDEDRQDGELIDNPTWFQGDKTRSRMVYENGMERAFRACHTALKPEGRLVVVFAHKNPEAWEALVGAIIRAGFVVDASWPIQTEMGNRMRAQSSAALSSSVWLVCKKRPEDTRPGWDNRVLEDMQTRITKRLHAFWDDGIHGPDFVWAATGPALEAYSRFPAVRKADVPGEVMTVREFLGHVRRLVVDFAVGRVLRAGEETAEDLDPATNYYLLHRNDFALEDAPVGACILYALSCGTELSHLQDLDLLAVSRGKEPADEGDTDVDGDLVAESAVDYDAAMDGEEIGPTTGTMRKLKDWTKRKRQLMGYQALRGGPVPLIDQAHRLMHLWRAGNQFDVNLYLDDRNLWNNGLFHKVLQAVRELADKEGRADEVKLLDAVMNHMKIRTGDAGQLDLASEPAGVE